MSDESGNANSDRGEGRPHSNQSKGSNTADAALANVIGGVAIGSALGSVFFPPVAFLTLGVVAYGLTGLCWPGHWKFEDFLVSAVCGAAFGLGLHLFLSALNPAHLVHAIGPDGKPIHAEIEMDMTHRIHIAVGALATVYTLLCSRSIESA